MTRHAIAILAGSVATVALAWPAVAAEETTGVPGVIDLTGAIDEFTARDRAAIGHLQMRDAARAKAEIIRARDAWEAVARHAPARKDDARTTAMVDTAMRLVTADMMMTFGRPEVAEEALMAACRNAQTLRPDVAQPGVDACDR